MKIFMMKAILLTIFLCSSCGNESTVLVPPDHYCDGVKPTEFYVKSKTSKSVSLHWTEACHKETYQTDVWTSWNINVYRSNISDGIFEKINTRYMSSGITHSMTNIQLNPSTTYYYKLELWAIENGQNKFLKSLGNVISMTTDTATATPTLSQTEKDNAIIVATKQAGGLGSYSFINFLNSSADRNTYLGKMNSTETNINLFFSVLLENELGPSKPPYVDCFVDIFNSNGDFLGQMDNGDTLNSEIAEYYPLISDNHYFRVGSWGDYTGPKYYSININEY